MLNLNQSELENMLRSMSSGSITASDLEKVIKGLSDVHKEVKAREDEAQRKKLAKEKAEREKIESVTFMELPLDYENYYEYDVKTMGISVESSADALIASLNNLGRVDIEYMSVISGLTHKQLITELKGSSQCLGCIQRVRRQAGPEGSRNAGKGSLVGLCRGEISDPGLSGGG